MATPDNRSDLPQAVPLARLKRRAEFLHVAMGRRDAQPGLVLQARRRPDEDEAAGEIRYGLTATRKLGNAVVRNRARRRLRAIANAILPLHGRPGTDYVLIGRQGTLTRRFDTLGEDLKKALSHVHRSRAQSARRAAPQD